MGHNEQIVGKALRSYGGSTDDVVVGTKGGITRSSTDVRGATERCRICARRSRSRCARSAWT